MPIHDVNIFATVANNQQEFPFEIHISYQRNDKSHNLPFMEKKKKRKKERGTRISTINEGSLKEITSFHLVLEPLLVSLERLAKIVVLPVDYETALRQVTLLR